MGSNGWPKILLPIDAVMDGITLMAAYTSTERARAVREIAPHVFRVNGGALLRRIKDGVGIAVNPNNHGVSFEMYPEQIEAYVLLLSGE